MLKSLPPVGETLNLSQTETALFLIHAILFSLSLTHSLYLSSPHRHCFSLSVQCVRMWLLGIQFLQQLPSLSAVWRGALKPPPSRCLVFCHSGEVRPYVIVQPCVESDQSGLDTLNEKLRQTHDLQKSSVEMIVRNLMILILILPNDSDFS